MMFYEIWEWRVGQGVMAIATYSDYGTFGIKFWEKSYKNHLDMKLSYEKWSRK